MQDLPNELSSGCDKHLVVEICQRKHEIVDTVARGSCAFVQRPFGEKFQRTSEQPPWAGLALLPVGFRMYARLGYHAFFLLHTMRVLC
mmetsp:Transcript_2589/g.9275  ORF Transcript_2589/g.9275 Transcript_2589/m.9275 type:complete len:88 (-) Transcript_2589:1065-1328(-)